MRVTIGSIAFVVVCASACGSVGGGVDGPPGPPADAGPDGGAVSPGTIRWARSLSAMAPLGVAEGSGGLVVTGHLTTTADLGGDVMTSAGGSDGVVASFTTSDATHLYSYRFGTLGSEYPWVDDTEAQGTPYVVGVAYGPYDLGMGSNPGGGGTGSDGYIGRYSPTGPVWVRTLVGPGEDKILDTALGAGTVFAIGWYEQTSTLEGQVFTAVGQRDILITRWAAFGGQLQLVRNFSGSDLDEGSHIAALGADIVGVGFFTGTLGLASPPLVTAGGRDVWVSRMTADLSPVWAVSFGGVGEERDPRVTTDTAGDVYITGDFSGPTAFGAVNLTPVGGIDTFVAKLRGADGSVVWATSIGSPGNDVPHDIAVDDGGSVYLAATVAGAIEPGGPFGGGLDAALVAFDTTSGTRRWNHVFGSPGDDRSGPLDLGETGLYYGLAVSGPVDLGGVEIIGAPAPAGLMLRIEP